MKEEIIKAIEENRLTEFVIDQYNNMPVKTEFCISYKNRTGQQIDWKANCILCAKYHAGRCHGCPLDSDSKYCDYYFKLADPELPLHMRPAICDKIIEAIKSFKG